MNQPNQPIDPPFTCIAHCKVCGKELQRVGNIPQSRSAEVAQQAPRALLCPEQGHNYNVNLTLTWYPPGYALPPESPNAAKPTAPAVPVTATGPQVPGADPLAAAVANPPKDPTEDPAIKAALEDMNKAAGAVPAS